MKEAEKLGRIKERPGAMFTDLIKRKARELGMDFTKGSTVPEPIKEICPESGEVSESVEAPMFGCVRR